MQPKHADSATEEGLRDKDPTDVPLAVLYAIEANSNQPAINTSTLDAIHREQTVSPRSAGGRRG